MASPVGHAMVGLATAAVVARATDTPGSVPLWLGALIACGLPDLDLAPVLLRFKELRFHRNASHSLVLLGALAAAGWGLVALSPLELDSGVALAWTVALLSHPILDVFASGPITGAKGYGIPLFWPLHRRRWYVQRPMFETLDLSTCRSVRDVWEGVRPELYWLGPICGLVLAGVVLL